MRRTPRQRHLQFLRECELRQAVTQFPVGGQVLEIGAGAGWQAKQLKELGYQVHAIDIVGSHDNQVCMFPVIKYDGLRIPFADASFDVIFSSNVLEHVMNLDALEAEIRRVLRPHGVAIHIVPTTSWRLWTLLTHHLYIARLAIQQLQRHKMSWIHDGTPPSIRGIKLGRSLWCIALWPEPHGAIGSALTELVRFSRHQWAGHFVNAGWEIQHYERLGLFYTGNQILHGLCGQRLRRILAHVLGSATQMFKLTPL